MKKMKVIVLVLALVLASVCAGCKASEADVSFLTSAEHWYFYDEVIGENEVLSLRSDYTFSYHCECGEPIGGSDVFDKFSYNPSSMTIQLYNEYDNSKKDISVLSYNPYHLMLEIDGEVKTFTPVPINSSYSYYGGEEYISGYEGYCTIFEIEDGNGRVGPFNYDADAASEYPDGTIEIIDLAENAEFYELNVDTDVDSYGQETHQTSYDKLTLKKVQNLLKDGTLSAFMWYNDSLEVEKMIFYGQTIVYN